MSKACLLVLPALALLLAGAARAQCNPGDVLVGEDENNYYCKDRKTYSSCVGAAGRDLQAARPGCAARVERCFRDNGYALSGAGMSCVLGCLGSAFSIARCTAACGGGAIAATGVLEKCGVDLGNACLGDALVAHRRAVDLCKQ